MRASVVSLSIGCFCALAQADARAQSMADPMRPPRAASSSAQPPSTSGLQLVLTSPQRKLAVIDGVVVPLGASVRKGTLDGVSDSLAVLKKNGERDILLMHPGIEKRPARRERP